MIQNRSKNKPPHKYSSSNSKSSNLRFNAAFIYIAIYFVVVVVLIVIVVGDGDVLLRDKAIGEIKISVLLNMKGWLTGGSIFLSSRFRYFQTSRVWHLLDRSYWHLFTTSNRHCLLYPVPEYHMMEFRMCPSLKYVIIWKEVTIFYFRVISWTQSSPPLPPPDHSYKM